MNFYSRMDCKITLILLKIQLKFVKNNIFCNFAKQTAQQKPRSGVKLVNPEKGQLVIRVDGSGKASKILIK